MKQKIVLGCAIAVSAPALGGVVAYSNWGPTDPGPGPSFELRADSAVHPDELGFNFTSNATGNIESISIAAASTLTGTGQQVALSVWSVSPDGAPSSLLASSSRFLPRTMPTTNNLYVFEFDADIDLESGTTYSLVMSVLGSSGGAQWGLASSVAETIVYRFDSGEWTVQPPSVANATMTAHIVVTPVPHTLTALGAAGLCVARRRRERMKG